ncbi:MAG: peptide ABC transporter substrate-binding protein [Anaerotruncus sp.]|nr:peptide ABC transporter substrate-binding protein [Anaerotruncus sp.]
MKYDISNRVTNLDPQFATDETARMIILNTFEGLYQQLPSGEVAPALAQSYERSQDGTVYTFHLRQDAVWSGSPARGAEVSWKAEDPVTAHDFAFALSRMFDATAFSPYASAFSNLENAAAILAGEQDRSSLGVRALDDYTLEIRLEQPDNHLLELLATSAAMPCQRTFFESARARYGLALNQLRFNGPFQVTIWEDAVIGLRRNPVYPDADPATVIGVNLYVCAPDDPPTARFLSGETDACKVDYAISQQVIEKGGSTACFEDTVWVLALNQSVPCLALPEIRIGLAQSIDRSLFDAYLPENLRIAGRLIPPAVDGRSPTPETPTHSFRPAAARDAYIEGLAQLGLERLPISELLICSDNNLPLLAGCIQQSWQRHLPVSTGLVRLSQEELLERVYAGDYEAAILPLSASYGSPDALLSNFRSDSPKNFAAYRSESFDTLIASSDNANSTISQLLFAQAEQLLLDQVVVIPLFYETSYYAMGKGVSGIEFSPFLSNVSFRNAVKA